MNRGLISAAQSMANSELRVGAISANLANVSTPGYKRLETSQARFELPGVNKRSPRTALITKQVTSFDQGPLQLSGRELDLALKGDGFFVLDGPEGELLTRNGVFMLDRNGSLVNEEGHPVAWRNRTAQLDPTFKILVSNEGEVRQDGRVVGQLDIRAYSDNSKLSATGGGDFTAPIGLEVTASNALVTQGAVEGSNATAVDQLVEMITAQRAYERGAQVVQTISQNYQRLTRPF